MRTPAQQLATLLKEKKLTVAFAESMTCGLAAHRLGTTSGASGFLKGSIVCYDESVKVKLLHVDAQLIEKYSAESQQVTDALARNLESLITSNVYGAVTGLASPGGSEKESKPVGTVFFSVYFNKKIHRLEKRFRGSPLQVKINACNALFRLIAQVIQSV